MKPTISVVIPAHDSATTIVEALESVLAQSVLTDEGERRDEGEKLKAERGKGSDEGGSAFAEATEHRKLRAELEVIIVDDASSDQTVAVVQEWIEEHTTSAFPPQADPPVADSLLPSFLPVTPSAFSLQPSSLLFPSSLPHLTFQLSALPHNLGPAAARNKGIQMATGDWIAFLDADDAWLPWRLDQQLRLADQRPEVVLWCAGRIAFGDPLLQPPSTDISTQFFGLTDLVENNPITTTTVLVKKAVLDDVGGFDESFRGPEDYDLWMRIASQFCMAKMDTPVCRYRQTVGSLSMDDRTFLPEVSRVLEKAYGAGGAMEDHPEWKRIAFSTQHWNASWMAFQRGARGRAMALWWRAWMLNLLAVRRIPRPWWPLLFRYMMGRRSLSGARQQAG